MIDLGQTIFSKIWDKHLLAHRPDGQSLIYIDRHITHEVTSPLAFESLRAAGRKVRRPDLTFATMDHNVPTGDRSAEVSDPMSAKQMAALAANASYFQFVCFDHTNELTGISHVIGPQLGLSLPGITIACGDSHTPTHGAMGALAIGIGTSEGEHVFATQTLWVSRPKEMRIDLVGSLPQGVSVKDAVMWILRSIGTGGALTHLVEFSGPTVSAMSVEQRMTLTNMIVEGGARTAIIEPDEKVFDYVRGSLFAPEGGDWAEALEYWGTLKSDNGASYDAHRSFDVSALEPQVSWGTNPTMTVGISESVPRPQAFDAKDRSALERALKYMCFNGGERITDIPVQRVFIGSCTNGRISDLIDGARVAKGRRVAQGVRAMVVPGSQQVKKRAEALGLDRIYKESGFEWRNSGCSLCLGMNEDRLSPGERCAATSNRNFENRMGPGGRTHLLSPMTAAASAIVGKLADPRKLGILNVDELGLSEDLA